MKSWLSLCSQIHLITQISISFKMSSLQIKCREIKNVVEEESFQNAKQII